MEKADLARLLPAVHEVLRLCAEAIGVEPEQLRPGELWREAARKVIGGYRRAVLESGELPPSAADLVRPVRKLVAAMTSPRLHRVINGSGVVLHTNLGRAPLAEAACAAIQEVCSGYSNLELNLASGERGLRYRHLEDLLTSLTGAEGAIVVNNNAGAVLLALRVLARGREAIVSRGELVEIGGSFRIPEVMEVSGALLKEVGTTNKTHSFDYERAIGPETALLLKVHPSNYRIQGFTSQISRRELVEIARRHQLPVMEDLGSGVLIDMKRYGLESEPTVGESVAAGVDLVTFSGDKLLGGPQAGIIVGRRELIARIGRHPLLRALRVDKMTIAALEATLREYQLGSAADTLPVWQMLTISPEQLRRKGEEIKDTLAPRVTQQCRLELAPGESQVGGGSLPVTTLPTTLVALHPLTITPALLAERLRRGKPAVLVRIQEETVLIDPRTVMDGEIPLLREALVRALTEEETSAGDEN